MICFCNKDLKLIHISISSGRQVEVSSLIAALETLESKNKVSLEHGKSRYVGHASSRTKYMCSGVAPNHGGKGIRESGIKDLPEAQWKGLIKFIQILWFYRDSRMQSDLATLQQCQDLLEHTRMLQFMEQYPAGIMCSSPATWMRIFSILLLQCR